MDAAAKTSNALQRQALLYVVDWRTELDLAGPANIEKIVHDDLRLE